MLFSHHSSPASSTHDHNSIAEPAGEPETRSARKKREKAEEKEKIKLERDHARLEREAADKLASQAANVDYSPQNYGQLPLNMSNERTYSKYTNLRDITSANVGEHVLIRARLQTSRGAGSGMAFVVLRQQSYTIQALVQVELVNVSKPMVHYVEKINPESIVLVEGTFQKAEDDVKSCTIHYLEIKIQKIHIISEAPLALPFTMHDASRADSDEGAAVGLDTRLDNRVLDLRTPTSQGIFKIQSGICQLFRDHLNSKGFIEIHTPKLQAAATESGSSVFKVSYFSGKAYLAQSPQLAKQMCIAGDMERVYEIGPVFRAENANGYRHLTEFMGLDLEMAFEEHYHEVMETIDELFKAIFGDITTKFAHEIDVIQKQFPCEPFTWLEETLVLTYKEAIALLREANWLQDGQPMGDYDDMSTTTERELGVIVKAKYHTDYYIIDKFPLVLRAFYTMPDAKDPVLANAYDFFMRGEEILSGAQRIHDPDMLEERMRSVGINPAEMKSYVDAFRLGAPAHGGGGIGLERVVMLFLKLGNIRRASLFPRDPKRLQP